MKRFITFFIFIIALVILLTSVVMADDKVILPPDTFESDSCEHDWVIYETVSPTCTTPGYSSYMCSNCEETKTDNVIAALGHNYVTVEEVQPTCTTKGHNEYQLCLRCGDSTYKEYNLLEHVSGDIVIDDIIKPTCIDKGSHSEATYCTNCGTELSFKTVEDVALGHDYVVIDVTEATCINSGITVYECQRCKDSYDERIDIVECEYINGLCKWCGKLSNDYVCMCDKFDDMPNELDWSYKGLVYCVGNGIFAGTSDTLLSPNNDMTRAMFVTVLYRMSGYDGKLEDTPFTDLKASWYKDAAAWAYQIGITSGVSKTSFSPNSRLTREQAVTMLYNYNKSINEPNATKKSYLYVDSNLVSNWSKDAVLWAIDSGLISGIEENGDLYIKPQGIITRSQIALILMNYIEMQ